MKWFLAFETTMTWGDISTHDMGIFTWLPHLHRVFFQPYVMNDKIPSVEASSSGDKRWMGDALGDDSAIKMMPSSPQL